MFLLFFESKFSLSFIRYFKTKDGLYGLSCFERIAVDNVAERGARMKSVGILCAKYTSLHEHMPFLEEEVRYAISIINSLILVIYIMTLYFSILFFTLLLVKIRRIYIFLKPGLFVPGDLYKYLVKLC